MNISKPANQKLQITVFDEDDNFIYSTTTIKSKVKLILKEGSYNIRIEDYKNKILLLDLQFNPE